MNKWLSLSLPMSTQLTHVVYKHPSVSVQVNPETDQRRLVATKDIPAFTLLLIEQTVVFYCKLSTLKTSNEFLDVEQVKARYSHCLSLIWCIICTRVKMVYLWKYPCTLSSKQTNFTLVVLSKTMIRSSRCLMLVCGRVCLIMLVPKMLNTLSHQVQTSIILFRS